MRLERNSLIRITNTRKTTDKNVLGFINWQVTNIARVLSSDLDAKSKQEMIKVIVDWPYVSMETLPSMQ